MKKWVKAYGKNDYGEGDQQSNLYAQTKYSVEECLALGCGADDIEAGDTATFVWEIA